MNIVEYAKEIFNIEIKELEMVRDRVGKEMITVAEIIKNSKGKVVFTGVGKSGIIGKKIAATLSSTGTLAVFMNSSEGLHGDLGMIEKKDIVIAISNSGNSEEILSIIPSIKKIGATIIAMTGNKNSKLGKEAYEILDTGVEREACPMNIAPTCSTTAMLVMGDALASILIKLKQFSPENFAVYHPGGSLGRRLLMKVRDVMHSGNNIAIVRKDDVIDSVLMTMTNKRLGAVCVVEDNLMIGLITEGDIRRALKNREQFFSYRAKDIMNPNYIHIEPNKMAVDALELMENRLNQISVLPVIENGKIIGIVRIHDLLNSIS